MREVRLILPLAAPKSAVEWLRRRLLDDFEGYTSFEAVCGGWRNGAGEDESEPALVFDVAVPDEPHSDWAIWAVVLGLFARTSEQALYVRDRSGEVRIYNRAEVAPSVAA